MPYLKTIVKYINEALQEKVLSRDTFCRQKVVGIAQSMVRFNGENKELLPSYVCEKGEAHYLGPDDDFDIIIYHRVNSLAVQKGIINKGFGDSKGYDVNTARMSLVVFGRRDKLRLTNDELAIYLQSAIPEAASSDLMDSLQLKACNINVNDIILNDLQVFNEEFQNIDYFLAPEQFLFKINYSNDSAFLKECYNINNQIL
jgi:hypothetical protein